jgi:CGNR zinc finger protein/putative stress-induced transcription regulator
MNTVTSVLGPDAALGLANSLHGPGAHYGRRASVGESQHDHLETPSDAVAFLVSHAIPDPGTAPTEPQLNRLRDLRAMVRSLADAPNLDLVRWRGRMDGILAAVDFRLTTDGTIRSAARGWDGIAQDLLPAALSLSDERNRLRRCGNPRCRWLFVDRSRRGGRIWCEASVCGNRMRVRRHRMRPKAALR